jgi:hypothetical protein
LENLTPKFDAMSEQTASFLACIILVFITILFLNEDSINPKILNINEEMRLIYKSKILQLEEYYFFNESHYPKLEDGYFDANPTLVLIGQYTTDTVFNFHHFLFFDISAFIVFFFFLKNFKNKYFPGKPELIVLQRYYPIFEIQLFNLNYSCQINWAVNCLLTLFNTCFGTCES